jgi:hypothetical protein
VEKDQFVGVWTLVSAKWNRSDGKISHLFGSNAVGRLIYTSKGHMCAAVMDCNRTPFVSGDPRGGTQGEIKTAYEGCIFYYGTFDINEREGFVIHHVERSSFPNWEGRDQKRFFEFSGNQLKLWHNPILVEGIEITGTLIWERIEKFESDTELSV